MLYLEGCILGVGTLEAVKYYSDIDLAPKLYNLYSPLYHLCNIGARLAPSPICGPIRGVSNKETDLYLGVKPLQLLLLLEYRNHYSIYLIAINI